MNRIGTPVARKMGTSVAPLAPIWSCPATTALTRSGPPRSGWNSPVTPWARKNPFSRATTIGAIREKSPSTAEPIFTVGPWAADRPHTARDAADGDEASGRDLEELASRGGHGVLSSHGSAVARAASKSPAGSRVDHTGRTAELSIDAAPMVARV